jgi:GMP synthase-like glutamine amidotransferase
MQVLAVTHGPSVGPGVFADAVEDAGHELVEWPVQLGGKAPEGADAVIVLGGAMHPDEEERHGWLSTELRWLEGLLENGTPLLGVCLGSQLVARAAGADVFRSPESEVGWYSVELTDAARADPVATSLPERFDAFQWHHYTHTLPAGAVELARSRVCTQAFRVGNAWGVQFHPEVRVEQVEEWLSEDPEDVTDPETFIAATRSRIEGWNELGRRLCSAFLSAA